MEEAKWIGIKKDFHADVFLHNSSFGRKLSAYYHGKNNHYNLFYKDIGKKYLFAKNIINRSIIAPTEEYASLYSEWHHYVDFYNGTALHDSFPTGSLFYLKKSKLPFTGFFEGTLASLPTFSSSGNVHNIRFHLVQCGNNVHGYIDYDDADDKYGWRAIDDGYVNATGMLLTLEFYPPEKVNNPPASTRAIKMELYLNGLHFDRLEGKWSGRRYSGGYVFTEKKDFSLVKPGSKIVHRK